MSIPGIRFNDCVFTEPAAASHFAVPKCAGVVAVLVSDPNWAPKAYQVVYFGEFGYNTPTAALPFDYQRLQAAAHGRQLMLSVLPLPYSTTAQRRELRNELVGAYNPEFQREGALHPAGEMIAGFHQSYVTPTQAPRRRIGFMPEVEKAA